MELALLNSYFSELQRLSSEHLTIECNLVVMKGIKDFTNLAPGTEKQFKKYIPLMQRRIAKLKNILKLPPWVNTKRT